MNDSGAQGDRNLLLFHATTWNLEDFVAPDVVVHGHIHSAYHRVLPEGAIISVGAVSGSNNQDPRPAYTVLEVSPQDLALEVRRPGIPNQERVPSLTN